MSKLETTSFEDILNIIELNDVKTFQNLKKILLAQNNFQSYTELNKKQKDQIKNSIIDNMLEWAMKDPRRATIAKFYLEAYDRLFFVDKGVNEDNDGIVISFVNEGNIKIENS